MTRTPNSATSERSRRSAEAFEDVKEQRWKNLADAMGPRYAGCTLDNFNTADPKPQYAEAKVEAVRRCRDYLDDLRENVHAGKNVLFFGPKGTGKDHLMVGMLRECVSAGAVCRWWDGLTLYAELRRMVRESQSEGPLLKKLVEADVCAISDPLPPRGASITEFIADFMFRLVDGRYRRRRPTWITANVATQEEAETRLAPQIHDRLRDHALRVRCNWESYRRPDE